MTPTTFKCRQCGHLFISIEGDFVAPSPLEQKTCPKCGSRNTQKTSFIDKLSPTAKVIKNHGKLLL